MKTLYLTDSSSNIVVDTETNEASVLHTDIDHYQIRSIYYIDEPMHVVYQSGENKEELNAKKGDILIQFYNNRYNKYILDTLRTKQWAANIKNRRTLEQKEKEEWAKKQQDLGLIPQCEACENCESCGN